MWAVFIFVLGIFGIFLINLFGNITTTNQQDYTLIKNAVEAAMFDSVDMGSYRAGFYLCPNEGKKSGTYKFDSKNDYEIVLNSTRLSNEQIKNYQDKCYLIKGKKKINKEVFIESFMRRFANNINNNKSYKVTIQDVIEYPPKVSVRIDTYNTYGEKEAETREYYEGDFGIQNQIDAILEETTN